MRHRLTYGVLLVAVIGLLWAGSAAGDTIPAGALSTSSATLGAEGWYAGALPPPGLHVIDYTLYYRATTLKGQHGRDVNGAPFTDFEAWAIANVIRPVYVADTTIFGANPAWHVVIPIVHKSQRSDFFHQDKTGIGDIYVSPLILGWHSPPWHWVAGLDVIVPTGAYDKNDVTNIGNNHWTFEPAFAITYMGENGFMADTKLMYDVHTEDHDLNYQEGDQFHLDYNVGYAFGDRRQWHVGLCGYYLTSLEEDRVNGSRIHGSEERVFAIGPTVAYRAGSLFVEAKVQKEFMAQNRPEGLAAWLKLIFSF